MCDFFTTMNRKYRDQPAHGPMDVVPVSLVVPAEGAVPLLKFFLGRPVGGLEHFIYWEHNTKPYILRTTTVGDQQTPKKPTYKEKRAEALKAKSAEKLRTETAEKKKTPQSGGNTQPQAESEDRVEKSDTAPPASPSVKKKDTYCLRYLCGEFKVGDLKCRFGELKCNFTHVKKEDIDLERLKDNVEVFGKHVQGFDEAMGKSLVAAASV